jgi:hypothetical protein
MSQELYDHMKNNMVFILAERVFPIIDPHIFCTKKCSFKYSINFREKNDKLAQ